MALMTSPQVYVNRYCAVTVGVDGAIYVTPGDSLGRYSLAIHNDLYHVGEFGRVRFGAFQPIMNPDLIRAGETIHHRPTFESWKLHKRWKPEKTGERSGIPRAMKEAITLDTLKQMYDASGADVYVWKNLITNPVLYGILQGVGVMQVKGPPPADLLQEGIEIIDISGDLMGLVPRVGKTLKSLPALLPAAFRATGHAFAVVEIFAVPLGALADICEALSVTPRMLSFASHAYGVTSWAFGDPRPKPPRMLDFVLQMHPDQQGEYVAKWEKDIDAVWERLQLDCVKRKVEAGHYKRYVMAMGENDRVMLCKRMMAGFDHKFSGADLEAWQGGQAYAYQSSKSIK